jgi:hypothetical protein
MDNIKSVNRVKIIIPVLKLDNESLKTIDTLILHNKLIESGKDITRNLYFWVIEGTWNILYEWNEGELPCEASIYMFYGIKAENEY